MLRPKGIMKRGLDGCFLQLVLGSPWLPPPHPRGCLRCDQSQGVATSTTSHFLVKQNVTAVTAIRGTGYDPACDIQVRAAAGTMSEKNDRISFMPCLAMPDRWSSRERSWYVVVAAPGFPNTTIKKNNLGVFCWRRNAWGTHFRLVPRNPFLYSHSLHLIGALPTR